MAFFFAVRGRLAIKRLNALRLFGTATAFIPHSQAMFRRCRTANIRPLRLIDISGCDIERLDNEQLMNAIFRCTSGNRELLFTISRRRLLTCDFFKVPTRAANYTLRSIRLAMFQLNQCPFAERRLRIMGTRRLFAHRRFIRNRKLLRPTFRTYVSVCRMQQVDPFTRRQPVNQACRFHRRQRNLSFLNPCIRIRVRPGTSNYPSTVIRTYVRVPRVIRLRLRDRHARSRDRASYRLGGSASLPPDSAQGHVTHVRVSVR